ncbi:metallophosphoesterase [Candidatus Woesearchaeota archaeon]|nr:metallophosphoesterase [Candidatus Woesearchaeota archaeon]
MNRISLAINVTAIDLALLVRDTLIISDIHIGYEDALQSRGVLIPIFQLQDTIKRLETILKETKPKIVVINGDLKHEFGRISSQEWRDTLKLLDMILQYTEKIIIVKGNHDPILGPIARKRGIEIVKEYKINNVLIAHGDAEPALDKENKDVKVIIIGHEHPAIIIQDKVRRERFKCFLVGKYKRRMLIAQPSFFLLTEGSDVLKEKLLSPLLQRDLGNFDVYVVEDKIYPFGKIKNLR